MLSSIEWQFEVKLFLSSACHIYTQVYHRAREALRACLPEPLRDQTFSILLKVCNISVMASPRPASHWLTISNMYCRAIWSRNGVLRLYWTTWTNLEHVLFWLGTTYIRHFLPYIHSSQSRSSTYTSSALLSYFLFSVNSQVYKLSFYLLNIRYPRSVSRTVSCIKEINPCATRSVTFSWVVVTKYDASWMDCQYIRHTKNGSIFEEINIDWLQRNLHIPPRQIPINFRTHPIFQQTRINHHRARFLA